YRDYRIQKAFIFLGGGANGKSTLINLIGYLLGEENISSRSLQDLHNDRFAAADLYGKLANLYADLSTSALKQTGIFKMVTGGDYLKGERKFQGAFSFKNHAKLFFSANQLPQVGDDTDAFFRRWIIINFPNKFEGERADKNILKKLTTPEELKGLLVLAVHGLRDLLNRGDFAKNPSTEEIRFYYTRASDPTKAFVEECLERDPEGTIPKEDLYQIYVEYCQEIGMPPDAKNIFSMRLYEHAPYIKEFRGVKEGGAREGRVSMWKGVRVVKVVRATIPKGSLEKNHIK
ncbi:MAG: phage/plasmid primase, P4 family, partial [Candidatus Bathyarchaeia archaeon]